MLIEKAFDTGTLKVNYAESDSLGAPMVLLHGLTGRWQSWDNLIPELSSSWHLYAPDLRGHGKSGRAPDNSYHVGAYARDIIAFLKHISEPVVLMGHSLGALTIMGVASEYPAGVRAAILLDPPLCIRELNVEANPATKEWFSFVYETMKDNLSYDEVLTRCRKMLPSDAGEMAVKRMADAVSGVATGTVEAALEDRLLEGFDLGQTLQQIKSPTLLIRGDWDHGGSIREVDAEFFRANLPAAEIVKIPGANHNIPGEYADVVLRRLSDFLATL